MLNYYQILILALIQGACELLPVSSSAHVIVAEKLMRLDPASPEMTMLLVMLHTGTMFAVIVYFWNALAARLFRRSGKIPVVCDPNRRGDLLHRGRRLRIEGAHRENFHARRWRTPRSRNCLRTCR